MQGIAILYNEAFTLSILEYNKVRRRFLWRFKLENYGTAYTRSMDDGIEVQ